MKIKQIVQLIESLAPAPLQEEWDNSGLIIGNLNDECTGVLIALDTTEAVVEEAASLGLNLIVAHHPLIFKGLKRLNGATAVERTVLAAVQKGVAVYAAHTSADNAPEGVSTLMARRLGLEDVKPLAPLANRHLKLTTYVPKENAESVRQALFDAGAGNVGLYDSCSYNTDGTGTFRPLEGSNPYVGCAGVVHHEAETRIEVILPDWCRHKAEAALRQAHPYEEPAYEFVTVGSGADLHNGCGAVGTLPSPLPAEEFVAKVKEAFGCKAVRCSTANPHRHISRVALCGGSGAFLTGKAIAAGADAYVTADVKYHDFLDFGATILMVDAGHFETEHCVTTFFYNKIKEIFPNFAVRCANAEQNPVTYM